LEPAFSAFWFRVSVRLYFPCKHDGIVRRRRKLQIGVQRGLTDAELGGEGEFALAEVEGEESGGAKGECGSDVEDVERAGAEASTVLERKLADEVDDRRGEWLLGEDAIANVVSHKVQRGVSFGRRDLLAENAKGDRVYKFKFTERRDG